MSLENPISKTSTRNLCLYLGNLFDINVISLLGFSLIISNCKNIKAESQCMRLPFFVLYQIQPSLSPRQRSTPHHCCSSLPWYFRQSSSSSSSWVFPTHLHCHSLPRATAATKSGVLSNIVVIYYQ